MPINVYFSHSFLSKDERVHRVIRGLVEGLKDSHDLQLFDSVRPKSKNLTQRITSDIAQMDVVICIFTRRHRIGTSKKYTAPAYVGSEAAYAHGHNESLVLFLESGVDPSEMGLVSGLSLVHVGFERRKLDTIGFINNATDIVRSVLEEGAVAARPHHIFKKYELHHTVYPNGYIMMHYKIKIEVLANEPVRHTMMVNPVGDIAPDYVLPTSAELLANATQTCPYPTIPFVAFGAADPEVNFVPVDSDPQPPRSREFQVHFPAAGRVYEYEWMWGSPNGFDPKRPFDWFGTLVSSRVVDRMDVLLRVHRAVARVQKPVLIFPPGDRKIGSLNVDQVTSMRKSGITHAATSTEQTPLYRCYKFSLTPVPKGTDLLLVY